MNFFKMPGLVLLLVCTTLVVNAQSKCDELRRELEQIEKRKREIIKELDDDNCNQSRNDCPPNKVVYQQYDIQIECAELKKNNLKVHYKIRSNDTDKKIKKTTFSYKDNKVFDQNGKGYSGDFIKIGDTTRKEGDFTAWFEFQMVYDKWYDGYMEFFIGKENVTQISLLQFKINGKIVEFQNIDIKAK